jgi:putative FmdB family regulatory protein
MPIYEYQCEGCHHRFDVIQKMSDSPIKTCPQCTTDKVVRLVSAAGFQLKGSGWYATDFKTKDKPASASSGAGEKDASTKTETSSGSDSE